MPPRDAVIVSTSRTPIGKAYRGAFNAAPSPIPVAATMAVKDKQTGKVSMREVTLEHDEGVRPDTSLEGLAALESVRGPGKLITAGDASQLSDGASACVVIDSGLAERRGVEPLGRYVGMH